MRLIGYEKVVRKDNAGEFYRLYIEEENTKPTKEKGGCKPLVRFKKDKGMVFPAISSDNFMACVSAGLKVGSNVALYRDDAFHLCMKIDEPNN